MERVARLVAIKTKIATKRQSQWKGKR